MERSLKDMIQEKMKISNPYDVCDYFATDFASDYEGFEKDENNVPALEYLNDAFTDIDTDYYGRDGFKKIVTDTLEKALSML